MQMTDNCELLSIFPTPVVKFRVPDELMNFVPSLKEKLIENPKNDSSHYVSLNSYVLDAAELRSLKNWITARTTEFMRLVLTIDSDAILTQSWINKNAPEQYIHKHPHQNSIVSGVFYMDVPDGNALIIFHKPDEGSQGSFSLMPKYYDSEGRDCTYSSRSYKLPISTGELVLFPSWLLHSVPTNKTVNDRWSLAFNSMTSAGLGVRACLTEFIYPKAAFASEQPNMGGNGV